MQRNFLGLMLLLLLVSVFAGCKTDPIEPEPTKFRLVFESTVGTEPFALGQAYTHVQGQDFALERFRFLMSELRLVNAAGEEVSLAEDLLVDLGEGSFRTADTLVEEGTYMEWEVPAGTYQGVTVNLGVPADRNNGNPAEFPSGHPLSIRTGLHWVWSTGYIFLQIDGRADTLDDGIVDPDHTILFHPGTNELLRSLSWEDDFSVEEGQTHTLTVGIDVGRAFYSPTDTLDFRTEFFTHSTPVGSDAFTLAERVMTNLTEGGFQLK